MTTTSHDPRIDAYIARAAPFARPLLEYFREQVHAACPDVEEQIKWGHPAFMHHGIMCGMAAFKQHCAFNFWKGRLLFPGNEARSREAMGQFGRVTGMADLPRRAALKALIRKAAELNEQGVKVPSRRTPAKRNAAVRVPDDLAQALARNAKARKAFDSFSPSHRREYVEWIVEARREETRARRLATTLEWLAEGKPRNWKYL